MAMQYIEGELRRRGQNDLADLIVKARRGIKERRGIDDFPFPKENGETEKLEGDILTQAIEEYKRGPLTPELVTKYWREKFRIDGAKAGVNIEVPDCDWTTEEIQKPMVDVRGNPVPAMMIYKPEQIKRVEGLILLGKMYPEMEISPRLSNYTSLIEEFYDNTGWIKVETSVNAPNLGVTQRELEVFAEKQSYLEQRLSTYIIASQASKDLRGQYFDSHGTESRLIGSYTKDYDITAKCHGYSGCLNVSPLGAPNMSFRDLGGRFEQMKKTKLPIPRT